MRVEPVYVLAVFIIAAAFSLLFLRSKYISKLARSVAANVVPVGYCVAMYFFLWLFDQRFLVPFTNYSYSHKLFLRVNYPLPLVSLAILFLSNPGKITRSNHSAEVRRFEYDRILYTPFTECRTCLLTKPARSKHCSVCNACVAMQDHHCIWVNNCIGLRNYKYFILFLMINLYAFIYGFILIIFPLSSSLKLAWSQASSNANGNANGNATKLWAAFSILIRLGNPEKTGACLLILCTTLAPLVAAFTIFHLMYVYAGITTNEADKWEDIKALIHENVLFMYKPSSILLLRRPDGTFNRKLTPDEESFISSHNSKLTVVVTDKELPNIYDNGFASNARLLLSPGEP